MARPVTLCTLQWGDLPLDVICEKAKSFGFDGVELGLPSHLDVRQTDPEYYRNIKVTLDKYGLQLFCISNHLVVLKTQLYKFRLVCNCFVFRIIWSARRYVIISINGINPYCLIISGAMAILMECTCGRSKI